MQGAPHDTDAIELEFLTPTSIKVNGRWTSALTFEHLIRNLLRRIRFLSYFHCGEDLDVDAPVLIDAACAIKYQSDLHWIRAGPLVVSCGEFYSDEWVYRAYSLFG